MKFGLAVDSFLAGYSGRDQSLYTRLSWWVDKVGRDIELEALTPEIVDNAMCLLAQQEVIYTTRQGKKVRTGRLIAPATQNRYRAALASLLKHAKAKRWVGYRFVSPLTVIRALPEAEGRLCFLTQDEIERLIKVARTKQWRKLACLIRVGFVTGLRKGNLMALRWKDYDKDAMTVTVARTKNGQGIVAPLTAEAVKELEIIRTVDAKPDDLIFCGKHPWKPNNFRTSWESALRDANLELMPFHGLRHSTATHATRAGASTLLVMNLLGHKSPRMAARYAHVATDHKAEFVQGVFA